MTDFYVAPRGADPGSLETGEITEPYNGIFSMNANLSSDTIAGDIIKLLPTFGDFGLADLDMYPYTGGATTRMTESSYAGAPRLGSSRGASSSMSGRKIDFNGARINMTGAAGGSRRYKACLLLTGEDIEVIDADILNGQWDIIAGGIVAPGGAVSADQISWENCGLMMDGVGNKVTGGTFHGNDAWAYANILMLIPNAGVGGVSANKKTTILNPNCRGAHWAVQVYPAGLGGYDIPAGTGLLIDGLVAHDGCFGRRVGTDPIGPGYSHSDHGGPIDITGKYYGLAEVKNCDLSGPAQDLVQSIGYGILFIDNYLHDASVLTFQCFRKSGSNWTMQTITQRGGNAFKLALGSYAGTSPTGWMLLDGVDGPDDLRTEEWMNFVIRNRIFNISGHGVSSNGGNGIAIHANEMWDVWSAFDLFTVDASLANYFVTHNFCKHKTSGDANGSLANFRVRARSWVYNNIFWAQAGKNDVLVSADSVFAACKKNKRANGTKGGSGTWPTSDNLADGIPSGYVIGSGFPGGDPLKTAGTTDPYAIAGFTDFRKDIAGTRFSDTPSIGPWV